MVRVLYTLLQVKHRTCALKSFPCPFIILFIEVKDAQVAAEEGIGCEGGQPASFGGEAEMGGVEDDV